MKAIFSSGTNRPRPPLTQAKYLAFSASTPVTDNKTQVKLTWTIGSGSKRIIFICQTNDTMTMLNFRQAIKNNANPIPLSYSELANVDSSGVNGTLAANYELRKIGAYKDNAGHDIYIVGCSGGATIPISGLTSGLRYVFCIVEVNNFANAVMGINTNQNTNNVRYYTMPV